MSFTKWLWNGGLRRHSAMHTGFYVGVSLVEGVYHTWLLLFWLSALIGFFTQNIACKVFYANVFLRMRWPNPSCNLTSFTNLLIKSSSDPDHYVCVPKLVWQVTINIFILYPTGTNGVDPSPDLFGQICDVVHLLPNLTSFAILGCDAPTQLIQMMVAITIPPLLNSLELEVYGHDKMIFSVLGQLQHLTSLTLHMTNDPEFEHAVPGEWVHTVEDKVTMSLVSTIHWGARFISPVPRAAFTLMAACCFARSCDLLLDISFDGVQWEMEDALLIMSIIKSYKPAQLTLEYFGRELLALLAPEIVQLCITQQELWTRSLAKAEVWPAAMYSAKRLSTSSCLYSLGMVDRRRGVTDVLLQFSRVQYPRRFSARAYIYLALPVTLFWTFTWAHGCSLWRRDVIYFTNFSVGGKLSLSGNIIFCDITYLRA